MNTATAVRSHFQIPVLVCVAWIASCAPTPAPSRLNTQEPTERLAEIIDTYEHRGLLSGSVHVELPDGTVFEKGVQLADDERRIPNQPETIALIASVSKNYTAAAILLLEEQGALSVDDPLRIHFPEYPAAYLRWRNGREATIHHLLNHTSGLPKAYDDPAIERKLFREPIDINDIIGAIKNRPLVSEPGRVFSYSNTGYILLGEIVRRVTGMSFAQYARDRMFEPLHLNRTHVGLPVAPEAFVAASYARARRGRINYLRKHGIRELHMTDVFTDGNIVASARDVAAWTRQLGAGSLLQQASLAKMLRDYGAGYGYGWNVTRGPDDHTYISHDGGWLGYASHVMHDPATGATVVYVLNQEMPPRDERRFQTQLHAVAFPSKVALSDE